MGYGPVVSNGYGASYNPQADRIIFCISSFRSSTTTDSKTFSETLEAILLDMANLCVSGRQRPTPSPRENKISLQTIDETNTKKTIGKFCEKAESC